MRYHAPGADILARHGDRGFQGEALGLVILDPWRDGAVGRHGPFYCGRPNADKQSVIGVAARPAACHTLRLTP